MRKISGIILALSILFACYIMLNQMGLVESLDFGAGAYYYADIPEFDRYVNANAYQSPVSSWVIIALFFLWGALMYKFLLWLDN